MYFECNIPKTMPEHMHTSLIPKYKEMVKTVYARMEKLEEALDYSCLDGATFSKFAKVAFDQFFERFEEMSPTALADFVLAVSDGKKAEPRMEWPNAQVVVDTAFVKTEEWEFIRCLYIGGSDAAVVTGVSPYRVKQELYHDKRGTPVVVPEDRPAAIFKRGHFLEEEVVKAFCELTGAMRIPETRMFVSKKYPHCSANIDLFIRLPDGRIYIYEAKTTIEENFMPWVNDKVPGHYVSQMRQYPAVMDDDRICGTYIGCLFTNDFILGDVYLGSTFDSSKFLSRYIDRDEDAERELLEANEEFWMDYLDTETEPAPEGKVESTNGSATDFDIIKRFSGYADKELPSLKLDKDKYEEDVAEYLSLGEERKLLEAKASQLKKRQKQLSEELIKELGQVVEGMIPIDDSRYYEVKNNPVGKIETDLEKLEIGFPEAYAACVTKKQESYRVFSIKEKEYKKAK